jgi:hypothetical protein
LRAAINNNPARFRDISRISDLIGIVSDRGSALEIIASGTIFVEVDVESVVRLTRGTATLA